MTKLMGLNMMRRDGEAWVAQPARADRAVAWIPLISLWFGFVHEPIGAGDRGAAGQGQREAAFGLQKATASAHPEIPEDVIHGYRRINQFYDKWNTAALRLKEKSFDNAHFAFVHKGTFGDINQPKPEKYEIIETDSGFDAETIITVRNPPNAYRITGSTEPTTRRHQRNKWFMPFCRRLDMEYPSGIRHIIFNCATPISDGQIQVVQLLYRNDTEADCSTQELIDWDAAIIAEDRDMLESTDPDAIVDMSRKIEIHMPSDCPGMIMRKCLLQLLRAHGEEEQPREPV
jgi:phenylpropionate dioxygenase-like ring-hydroxylating dioxygenase large terminal subunit